MTREAGERGFELSFGWGLGEGDVEGGGLLVEKKEERR